MVSVSAPGKLMIFGEHAVVYGHPCVVTAVGERVTVSVEKTDDGRVIIEAPKVKNTTFVEEAIRQAKTHWNIPDCGLRVTTDSTFSSQYGFGSSSAVTVAVLDALRRFFEKKENKKELFDLAYKTILAVQGVGSGFDAAAAVWGGTLLYKKGGVLLEALKISGQLPLIVGYTGVKADTATIVREVADKRGKFPEKMDRIFDAIGKLAADAKQKIEEGDWERAGTLMDFNQEYLRDIGVSSDKLEMLISAAKKAGAWGAKLSGAGGGDCMIALASRDKHDAIKKAMTDAGGQVLEVVNCAPGVQMDTTDDQSELFVVVDKNDTVLGYKTRGECHADKTLMHRGIGLLVFDRTGRVLLQKRSMTKDTRPGYWSTSVGGHVMKGETYEQAIAREAKEELGIDVPMKLYKKHIIRYPGETEMEALFTATHEGPFHSNTEEIDEVKFFSKEELSSAITTGTIHLTEAVLLNLQVVGFL